MAVTPAAPALAPIAPPVTSAPKPASTGFGDSLDKMLQAVQSTGDHANEAVASMLEGHGDVHTALIAMQNADTTFQLSLQVRNKLVQAYQDIMRMPV